jgi:hypothetical protein
MKSKNWSNILFKNLLVLWGFFTKNAENWFWYILTEVLVNSKNWSNTFLENCWFFAGYFHDSNWLVLWGFTKTNLNERFLDSETYFQMNQNLQFFNFQCFRNPNQRLSKFPMTAHFGMYLCWTVIRNGTWQPMVLKDR